MLQWPPGYDPANGKVHFNLCPPDVCAATTTAKELETGKRHSQLWECTDSVPKVSAEVTAESFSDLWGGKGWSECKKRNKKFPFLLHLHRALHKTLNDTGLVQCLKYCDPERSNANATRQVNGDCEQHNSLYQLRQRLCTRVNTRTKQDSGEQTASFWVSELSGGGGHREFFFHPVLEKATFGFTLFVW